MCVGLAEIESFHPRITRPYAVESRWWSGQANVNTFQIEELMSTKLRALYQRCKGRNLFDLWHVLNDLPLDGQLVVDGLSHYMGDERFNSRELSTNVAAKLEHPDFVGDLEQLTVASPSSGRRHARSRPHNGASRQQTRGRPGTRRHPERSLAHLRRSLAGDRNEDRYTLANRSQP